MSAMLVAPWGGAVLGLVLGLGVVLLLSGLSSLRPPGLEERLAPYLPGRSVDDVASVRALRAWSAALRRTSSWLDRGLGGSASVRSRLARAGDPVDLLGFRSQQVLCGAVGLVVGAVLSGALSAGRGAPVPALVVVVLAAATAGVLRALGWA